MPPARDVAIRGPRRNSPSGQGTRVPEADAPIRAGDRATDFVLPAADRDGSVALGDYLGGSAVFLGLFRRLYCAFCRRAVSGFGRLTGALAPCGVQVLGVVASPTPHTVSTSGITPCPSRSALTRP
jgi:hypothetical protein